MARRRTRLLALLPAVLALQVAAAPAVAAPDPLLADQWALGERAIGAPAAWTQSRGDGVVVAVIDGGVQLDHPDLQASLWTNPDEIPGNRVDDDRNGFVDDVHGASMLAAAGSPADDDGHGTHVAGVVAAQADNGIGGSGLAPHARIMAVKIFDASRVSDSAALARGIRYAVAEGARILNVSLNGDTSSPALDAAIAYAGAHGATIVASAGNEARDLDLRPSYPAASSDPAVLSVTASGAGGALTSFASRGLHSVDLAAPGAQILSTARGSDYESRSGTSMATPYVSGALALLAAARPDLSQARLRDTLRASSRRPASLLGLLAAGALDVEAAMRAILPGALWREQPSVRLRTTAAVRAGRAATLRWTATGASTVARWTVYLDSRRVATRASRRTVLRKRVARPGVHRWKVVGVDAAGRRVTSGARTFRVLRPR